MKTRARSPLYASLVLAGALTATGTAAPGAPARGRPGPEERPELVAPLPDSPPAARPRATPVGDAPGGPPPPASSGPPPPMGADDGPTASHDASRPGLWEIQMVAGVEVGPGWLEELEAAVPVASAEILGELRSRWGSLRERFGLHPLEDVESVTLLRTRDPEGEERPFLLLAGSFDPDALWRALEQGAAGELHLEEEGGRRSLRIAEGRATFEEGARIHLLSSELYVVTPQGQDVEPGALRDAFPDLDPLDVAALRRHYGLAGTNAWFNMVVTPEMRASATRGGGPLSTVLPGMDTLGIRVEDASVQVGATFRSAQAMQQVNALATMGLGFARAALQRAVEGPAPAPLGPGVPAAPPEGFLELLDPQGAVKKGLLRAAARWLDGLELRPGASSLVIRMDREKMPWLRWTTMVQAIPLVTSALPMLLAYQQQAMLRQMGLRTPGQVFPGGGAASRGDPGESEEPEAEEAPAPTRRREGATGEGGLPPIPVPRR